MGRPALLDKYHHTDPDDGTEYTHGQYLVSRLWLGLTQADAARTTGVSIATVQNWLSRGRTARQLDAAGVPVPDLERPYVAFLGDYEAAEAHARERLVQRIYQAGTEPQRVKKVTVKRAMVNGTMVEVERTEAIEERPPQWTALAWIAERRWPEMFGRRIAVDTTPDQAGRDQAIEASALSDELDAYLSGLEDARKDAAIDVTEVPSET